MQHHGPVHMVESRRRESSDKLSFLGTGFFRLSSDANISSFSLAKSSPRDIQITDYKNNGLLMRNVVQLCLAANTVNPYFKPIWGGAE